MLCVERDADHVLFLCYSRMQSAKGASKGDDPADMERELEVLKVRSTITVHLLTLARRGV